MLTLGVMTGLKRRRLKIGRDVGLIGFDDAVWAQAVEPPLSVIAQPAYEMGVAAARLLVERIRNGPHDEPQTMIMSTTMIVRGSSRRARSRATDRNADALPR
jgi:LacI family transcriptional regulator